MGQGIGRVPEAPTVGREIAGSREPIGRFIAQQRRLRGIELEDLAARTRIPRRSLERLEAGAFDHSPDGFSRGFVRTVAEAIGLDPDDAVARMLPEPGSGRRGRPRQRHALGAIATAIALGAIALGANELVSRLPARTTRPPTGELPIRRDYVRALAETQGVATERLTARDAVLTLLPPPAPEESPEAASVAQGLATSPVPAPARAATATPPPAAASAPIAAPPASAVTQSSAPAAGDEALPAPIATEPALQAPAPEAAPGVESAGPSTAPATPPAMPAADAEAHD
jgi:hypothetical protein